MFNKTSPTLLHTEQADAQTLAVNGQLNGHLLPKYMDLSNQTKEENWFLRTCHYIVIGVNNPPE
jgi:hypothetical protein